MQRPALKLLRIATVATLLASATHARAENAPAAQATLAQHLFDEAQDAMTRGDVAHACPKFVESQRLEPGGGTILNIAHCHELLGRLASAAGTFREALAIARHDGRADRTRFAETRLAELTPRVPQLHVTVGDPDAEVSIDGMVVGAAALDGWLPLDPGEHRVQVKRAGYTEFSTTVTLTERARREVVVPALVPTIPLAAGATPAKTPVSTTQLYAAPLPETKSASSNTWRAVGWTGVGVGGAGLMAGGVLGLMALTTDATSSAACPGVACNNPVIVQQSNTAHAFATAATVSLISGLVLIGGGIYILVTQK